MFNNNALIEEMTDLRRFALRLTGNACDADDLLQATILRAIEKKHLFQADTNLNRWACKIMFNLFVSAYRRKSKFETRYDPELYLEKMTEDASQEHIVELGQVERAMQKLSPEHREIIVLICVKGMRYQEASEALKLPVGTVRSRLSRARECLQVLREEQAFPAHVTAAAESHRMAA